MDTRLRRRHSTVVVLAAVLASGLSLTACGGGKEAREHGTGNGKRPKPGSSVSAAPRDATAPVKPTRKDPRGVPGAPQNVPIPWRR